MSFFALPVGPPGGYLPYWQLLVGTIALLNGFKNITGTSLSRTLYTKKPEQVTELSARTFGAWTLTSAMVRLYAAYNITNPVIYQMALLSYFIAFFHFATEFLVFGTLKPEGPSLSPVVVSTTSIVWMVLQYSFYVKE